MMFGYMLIVSSSSDMQSHYENSCCTVIYFQLLYWFNWLVAVLCVNDRVTSNCSQC